MSKIDRVQKSIETLLQPGEKLLWWERPRLKYARESVKLRDVAIFSGTLALIWIMFMVWVISSEKEIYSIQRDSMFYLIQVYLFVFVVGACYMHLKKLARKAALKKAPPYWKHTLYAITDRRALQIITVPGAETTFLEYLPQEIDSPTSMSRSRGSGTVTFSVSRQCEVGRRRAQVMMPGSFFGIPYVQTVVALLQELRGGGETLAQSPVR
ncbi:MAG TPA: hypothetical protein VGN34_04030 [Ktedonobacteraceae bacterium]|jgi:hypothetical protein